MQRLPLPGPRATPEFAQREMNLRDILERWAGSDETLRVVMLAKSEEDKLKQEVMRLEVRRAEMEILKEAIRAGIQPASIPQLFGPATFHAMNLMQYTPVSPVQGIQSAGPRNPYAGGAQIPAFRGHHPSHSGSGPGVASPRYLPKIDTNLSSFQQVSSSQALTAGSDTRQNVGPQNGPPEAPQTAPPAGHPGSSPPPSLFFRNVPIPLVSCWSDFADHWVPPRQGSGASEQAAPTAATATTTDTAAATTTSTSTSTSPRGITEKSPPSSPRKKKTQTLHPILVNPGALNPSRRSPSRQGGGHARHKSEASALGPSRFADFYTAPTHSGVSSRTSQDRNSPTLLETERKRKRAENEIVADTLPTTVEVKEEG